MKKGRQRQKKKEVKLAELRVKYHNDFNKINHFNLSRNEYDLFMGIVALLRDNDNRVLKFSFDYIRALSGWKFNGRPKQLTKTLNSFGQKITGYTLNKVEKNKDGKIIASGFSLFTSYKVIEEKQEFYLSRNMEEQVVQLFNNLKKDYTTFDLSELRVLHKKQSKSLFRKMIQFRKTNILIVNNDELKKFIGYNDSFKDKYFTNRITEAIEEMDDNSKVVSNVICKKNGKNNNLKILFKYNERNESYKKESFSSDLEINNEIINKTTELNKEKVQFINYKEINNEGIIEISNGVEEIPSELQIIKINNEVKEFNVDDL